MDSLFSAQTRRADLDSLAAAPVDLLVIGGGITGAGIARDAALRGIRTALLDAGDFGGGTSSRSTRLVARWIALPRAWLAAAGVRGQPRAPRPVRIAPHLVRPMPFLFPVHAGGRVGRWRLAAGLWLYDLLSAFRNVHNPSHPVAARGAEAEPQLRSRDLVGGAVYYDAYCNDARLVLANARAAHRSGALVANYAAVRSFEKADGAIRGALVDDVLEGRRFTIHARVIVNATGPWTDAIRRLDEPDAQPLLRPTKGVHVAVPRQRVGNAGALTIPPPSTAGSCSSCRRTRSPSSARRTRTTRVTRGGHADGGRRHLPAALRERRLPRRAARAAGRDRCLGRAPAAPEGRCRGNHRRGTREHRICESAAGLLTIAGGKLTTYRVMAAELVDVVATKLHRIDGRPVPERAPTDVEPLPGGEVADLDLLVRELVKEQVPAQVAAHLVNTYGSEAMAVANLAAVTALSRSPWAPASRSSRRRWSTKPGGKWPFRSAT